MTIESLKRLVSENKKKGRSVTYIIPTKPYSNLIVDELMRIKKVNQNSVLVIRHMDNSLIKIDAASLDKFKFI